MSGAQGAGRGAQVRGAGSRDAGNGGRGVPPRIQYSTRAGADPWQSGTRIRPTRGLRPTFLALAILALTGGPLGAQQRTPYLSNLSATKDSPLYTSYTAAQERSEFTLDEGYHFTYYLADRGVEFTTDTGGDWGVAFRMGPRLAFRASDMHREPVITTSYADVVRYTYSPFENIRVDAAFVVHSSRQAFHDLTITNTGGERAELEAVAYLRNDERFFHDVRPIASGRALTMVHEELPDEWVIRKGVPYVARVRDVVLFSSAPDRWTGTRALDGKPVEMPFEADPERAAAYLMEGSLGGRCETPAQARLVAERNGDRARILTERAPRWGHVQRNIARNGAVRVELGHFDQVRTGDSVAVTVVCGGNVQRFAGTVGEPGSDAGRLERVAGGTPAAPAGLRRELGAAGAVRLAWDAAPGAIAYHVYRRELGTGAYERIATGLTATEHTDRTGGVAYGYVVTAEDAAGRMSVATEEATTLAGPGFEAALRGDAAPLPAEFAKLVAGTERLVLEPGESARLRVVRGVGPAAEDAGAILRRAEALLRADPAAYVAANERLYARIPEPTFEGEDDRMMYWGAFSMMRQVMLPPEGGTKYNYYVFSREPTWGWGHAGQVFHESLTMPTYALMDPEGAMDSQRVYAERQGPDGYIWYRVGAHFAEDNERGDQRTTSAPWYAWQNWELYKETRDTAFLREMYPSSVALYEYVHRNRDADGDGLYEWGGHAVLESVRDAQVAVWAEVGWPSNFEAVGLNVMMVTEAEALAAMATELGRADEARAWQARADDIKERINRTLWDEERGFYFHVDRKDNDFSFEKTDDLKREEIVGFLPLWAGIATPAQAERLVSKLTDPAKFWRRYGVPSLAADDSFYKPQGYWNGPVWVEWNYLIALGLLRYGYDELAAELTDRVADVMIDRLKKDHTFWEFYSPDASWGGHHQTYIWAGIINRMMLDVAHVKRARRTADR